MKIKFYTLITLLILTCESFAQPSFDVNFGANLVSRHIWRGLQIGATQNSPAVPHIQPNAVMSLSFSKNSSFEIGFVGTYGISNEYSESDFFARYSQLTNIGSFALQLFDYHYPFKGIPFSNFDENGTGAHTLEVSLKYTAPRQFPITLFVSNNIHNVVSGDKTFYAELNYPVQVNKLVDLNLFAGTAKGKSTWHVVSSDSFEIVNLGFKASRKIELSEKLKIPVSVTWTYNPHLKNSYLAFGLSI